MLWLIENWGAGEEKSGVAEAEDRGLASAGAVHEVCDKRALEVDRYVNAGLGPYAHMNAARKYG